MKLIIEIPDTDIPKRQDILSVDLCFVGGQVGQCTYPFEVLKQEPIEMLQEIRHEIENNMESIIGIYDSSTSESEMPSCKIARNIGRQECIKLIDTKIKELGK